jgi:hypothetical protein
MPHLVEMAEKWRDKGVVVLTLHVETSLDVEEGRDKSIEKARKILERLKVRGPNYHLAETQTVWMDRLEIEGYPAIFVFNKAGRIARKFSDEEEAKTEMATLIPKLTEEK